MTEDARFEEGGEAPLNLGALDAEDLKVISALCQDAVVPVTEIVWRPAERRFALLLNRFRWEDEGRDRHGPERVQSVLALDNVLGVATQGVARDAPELILSLLSVDFQPAAEPPGGHVLLTLAGDGAFRLEVEALEATLKDVTRPYAAPSRHAPTHPE